MKSASIKVYAKEMNDIMDKTDFILLNPQQEKLFLEIRNRIRCLQSGGTIDSLHTIGADTEGQIGASYISLKTLADEYLADEKMALSLWRQQKREEQIIGCFLLPVSVNREKITQYMNDCISFEIAGYFGSIFLHRHPELVEILSEWLDSEVAFLQMAALTAAARHRILNKNHSLVSEDFFKQIVKRNYKDRYVELVAQRYRFNI